VGNRLFGRVSRSVEAADADLQATIEDARDVAVTLAAETARNYIELRSYQRRMAIAQNNVSLQEQTAPSRERTPRGRIGGGARHRAGAVERRDHSFARADARGRAARGGKPARGPVGPDAGALAAELAEVRAVPVPPVSVAVGVPADLLRRRADVRRAERELAAEHARVGVAEGDLYPRLVLFGNVGVAADETSTLFESESVTYSWGPSLRWNLFDAGRLKNRVVAQEARTEQALVRWERTVLHALEESENAMTGFVREQERRDALQNATTEARRAVEISRSQYAAGLTDFQNVLINERAVTNLEDDLVSSSATIATQLSRFTRHSAALGRLPPPPRINDRGGKRLGTAAFRVG
jgi:outer membrane protein TolC